MLASPRGAPVIKFSQHRVNATRMVVRESLVRNLSTANGPLQTVYVGMNSYISRCGPIYDKEHATPPIGGVRSMRSHEASLPTYLIKSS